MQAVINRLYIRKYLNMTAFFVETPSPALPFEGRQTKADMVGITAQQKGGEDIQALTLIAHRGFPRDRLHSLAHNITAVLNKGRPTERIDLNGDVLHFERLDEAVQIRPRHAASGVSRPGALLVINKTVTDKAFRAELAGRLAEVMQETFLGMGVGAPAPDGKGQVDPGPSRPESTPTP